MPDSIKWSINSMDSLSLFGKVTLNSQQLKELSISKKIFSGYSEVLNRLNIPNDVTQIHFSAETTEDGAIWIRCNDGKKVKAGNLSEFSGLLRAMRVAHDAARIQFPEAFSSPIPKEELLLETDEVEAVAMDSNLGLFDEWPQVSEFRQGLRSILEKETSEKKKVLGALEFLRQKTHLTAVDLGEIADLHLSEEATLKAMASRQKAKREQLVRKVGVRVADDIAQRSGNLIYRLQNDDTHALHHARNLIEDADRAIFQARVKQIILLTIRTLTVVGALLSLVFLGPTLLAPFLLSSLYWLSIDLSRLSEKIVNAIYRTKLSDNGSTEEGALECPQFWQEMESPYVRDKTWNLAKLKADVCEGLSQMSYYLNGTRMVDFESCLEELGLIEVLEVLEFGSDLDFETSDQVSVPDFTDEAFPEEEMTPKQQAAFRWLTTIRPALLYPSRDLFYRKVPVRDAVENTRPVVDAQYDRESGKGTLRAMVQIGVAPVMPCTIGLTAADVERRKSLKRPLEGYPIDLSLQISEGQCWAGWTLSFVFVPRHEQHLTERDLTSGFGYARVPNYIDLG